MNTKSNVWDVMGWLFGIVVLLIGLINTFWGNDLGFGVFHILLSFVYFPPTNVIFKKITSFSIPIVIKILLGLFTIWVALGVGELFNKIELMIMDLG